MFILYGLYFDGIDDIHNEHIGDFDTFSLGHSQYFAFFFDGLSWRQGMVPLLFN